MSGIIKMFTQLGVDQTLFYQLIIFVALFFILKLLLFKKLQFVIDEREGKTTLLEKGANNKFAEAEKLAENYKSNLDKSYEEAQQNFDSKKVEINQVNSEKISETEKQIEKKISSKLEAFEKELSEKQEIVISQAPGLAAELAKKLKI